ncbi:MAG: EMC3/TMCO1 family protein [Candidatus Odinarchaeia archaeon]
MFEILEALKTPPLSTFFILGIAVTLAVISNLISRFIMDTKLIRRYSKQIREYKDAVKKAEKEGDEKKLIKLRRKSKYIEKITLRTAKERFKPMLITLVPFIVLFFVLRSFFTSPAGVELPVVYIPFDLGLRLGSIANFLGVSNAVSGTGAFGLYFTWWYMISSLSTSPIISRIFGISGE